MDRRAAVFWGSQFSFGSDRKRSSGTIKLRRRLQRLLGRSSINNSKGGLDVSGLFHDSQCRPETLAPARRRGQYRQRNHPRPRLMDTSRVDGVKTPRPRLVLVLAVKRNIKNLAVVSSHLVDIALPEAFLDRACVWRRRFRVPRPSSWIARRLPGIVSTRGGGRWSLFRCRAASGRLETLTAPTRSECTQNRRRNHARGREMATSPSNKVKAPRRLATRRARRPART